MKKNLPVICPSCENNLKVQRLVCENCNTQIEGSYKLPVFDYLDKEDQAFILAFVKSSGSLKDMSKQLDLSYPTVRNMLDDLIGRVNKIDSQLNKI
jgi:hypothetical protein